MAPRFDGFTLVNFQCVLEELGAADYDFAMYVENHFTCQYSYSIACEASTVSLHTVYFDWKRLALDVVRLH